MELSIEKFKVRNFFIFLTFFFMGFYQFNLTFIFFVISSLLLIRNLNKRKLDKDLFIYFGLTYSGVVLFYLISFINGMYDNFNNKGEVVAVLLFIVITFIILLFTKKDNYNAILNGFIFGLGGYSLVCLWSTMFEMNQISAYGKVWNPFLQVYQNSPTHAINLALLVTMLLINIKNVKFILTKFFNILLLFVCVYFGLYAGSRVFVLISLISLTVIFFDKKFAVLIPLIVVLFFIALSFFNDFINLDSLASLDRITTEGSESGRYKLYELGINNLFAYPFGGYYIDNGTYGTIWNHNLFLDISRMSGLIPLLLILLSFSFIARKILSNFKNVDKSFLLIFSCLFILMMQDVVFMGHYLLFILSFLISSLLIIGSKGEKSVYH